MDENREKDELIESFSRQSKANEENTGIQNKLEILERDHNATCLELEETRARLKGLEERSQRSLPASIRRSPLNHQASRKSPKPSPPSPSTRPSLTVVDAELEILDLQRQLEDANRTIAALQKKQEQDQEQQSSPPSVEPSVSNERVEQLEIELAEVRAALDDAKTSLSTQTVQVEVFLPFLSFPSRKQLEMSNDSLKKELEISRVRSQDLNQADHASLLASANQDATVADLTLALRTLESEHKALVESHSFLNSSYDSSLRECQELRNELDQCTRLSVIHVLIVAVDTMAAIAAQLTDAHSSFSDKLGQLAAQFHLDLEALSTSSTSNGDSSLETQRTLYATKMDLERVRTELESLRTTSTFEVGKWRDAAEKYRLEMEELSSQLHEKTKELRNTNATLTTMTHSSQRWEAKWQRLQQQRDAAISSQQQTAQLHDAALMETKTTQTTLRTLELQLSSTTTQMELLQQEHKNVKSQLRETQLKLVSIPFRFPSFFLKSEKSGSRVS